MNVAVLRELRGTEDLEKYLNVASKIILTNKELDEVKAELENTLLDPDEFIETCNWTVKPDDDLLWLTLIDCLINKGYILEFNWTEEVIEIEAQLHQLFKEYKVAFSFDLDDEAYELSAGEMLTHINPTMKKETEYIFVSFDICNKSYATALVMQDNAKQLVRLDDRIKIC